MISVIIPVYNSDKTLIEIKKKIQIQFENKFSYEIIFIDDGSINPETWKTIKSLTSKNVFAIKFSKNFGKHSAIMCGFEHASGDYIITIDDDLDQDPSDIEKLLVKKEHDVVVAQYERNYNLLDKIFSKLKHLIDVVVFKNPKKIRMSPLKLIKKNVVKQILKNKSNKVYLTGLIHESTNDIESIFLGKKIINKHKSNFSFEKKIEIILRQVFNYSLLPIKSFLALGILGMITSIIIFLKIIYNYIFSLPLKGWSSILLSITFFGSLNLLLLSIIGIYVFNLNSQKNSFLYAIKEKIGLDDKEK